MIQPLIDAAPDYAPLVEFQMIPGNDWKMRWDNLGRGISIEYVVDSNLFARMIAKIGHAFAAAVLGLDAFTPTLPSIIRGDTGHAMYVGGLRPEHEDRTAHPDTLHLIQIEEQSGWAVVQLRLFAFLKGSPTYNVVAGRLI